jgi:hypothetical protein
MLLVCLLVVALVVLTWTAVRRAELIMRRAMSICVGAIILAAIPVDVWVIGTGRGGVGAGEVVWGTLSVAPVRDGRVVVLSGGCVEPRWNPTRYALWISY